MQTFSPSPRHRETASSTPPPQNPNAQPTRHLNLQSILRKTPSIPKQVIPQPSPGILTPHQQSSPSTPHPFPPQRHKGDRAGRFGRVPYLVSKIIPQREGPSLFSAPTLQVRQPRVGQPGRDGLVPKSVARTSFAARNAQRGFLHARGRSGLSPRPSRDM